jgi:hypothetical protein
MRASEQRDGRVISELSQLVTDVRLGVRQTAKHRLFSAAVVITLAVGLGVNTTVFTLVHAVLFKPLPVPNGERLVTVVGHRPSDRDSRFGLSFAEFRLIQEEAKSFDGLAAATGGQAVVSEDRVPPEALRINRVTPNLFDLLARARARIHHPRRRRRCRARGLDQPSRVAKSVSR